MLLESESSVKVSAGIHAFRRLSLLENLGGDSWGRIGCLSLLSQCLGAPDALWLVAASPVSIGALVVSIVALFQQSTPCGM